MELGKAARMNSIVDNGTQTSQMGMENMCGEMGMYMKANGKLVWDMVKDPTSFLLEILTSENIFTEKLKVMDSILGVMEMCI